MGLENATCPRRLLQRMVQPGYYILHQQQYQTKVNIALIQIDVESQQGGNSRMQYQSKANAAMIQNTNRRIVRSHSVADRCFPTVLRAAVGCLLGPSRGLQTPRLRKGPSTQP